MNPEQLARLVKAHFQGPRAALRAGTPDRGRRVQVLRRQPSQGDTSPSPTVSTTYYLKLADAPDHLAKLRKWHSLGDILHERHRAPRIVDWIDVPDTGYGGLLCEHIPGHVWEFRTSPPPGS